MKTKLAKILKTLLLVLKGKSLVHKKPSSLGFTFKSIGTKKTSRSIKALDVLKKLSSYSKSPSSLFLRLKPGLTFLLILILILVNTLVFTKGIIAQKGYFVKDENPEKELAYLAIQGNEELDLYPPQPNIDTSSQIVLAQNTEDSPSAQNNTTSTLEAITTNGASATQNLSLQGGVSFGSGIKVKELAEFQSSVLIQERLNVGTLSTFSGDLVAQQDATVYGSATINQNLTVGTKDLYVDTTTDRVGIGTKHPQRILDVAGDAKVGKQLLVIEDTHLFDTLTVDGWTKMTGILNADGGIEIDGDIFTIDGKRGDVETKGTIRVDDQTWLNSNVSLGDNSSDTLETNARIGSSFIPKTTNTYDLGSSSLYWNNVYVRNLYTSGTITPSGNIVPGADNTYSLGSSLYRWKDLFLGPASLKIYNSIGANAEYMTFGFDSNVARLNITRDGSGIYRPFAINQNGSEAIRITGGNLGIGTTNPLYKLDVNGDGRIQGGELYLSGIASSSSTTEGTLYYDTDDDQLKVYANGKWQADRSTATIIVAANDSQNKEKADYVCDGTDDQVEIQAAVEAIGSTGGIVLLLEGTYNLAIVDRTHDSAIYVTNNDIVIQGQGWGTVLNLVDDTVSGNIVYFYNVDNVAIKDLKIDGNTDGGKEAGGIYIKDSNNVLVENCSLYAVGTFVIAVRDVTYGRFIGNRIEIVTEPSVANRGIDFDYVDGTGNTDIIVAHNRFMSTNYFGAKVIASKLEHTEDIVYDSNWSDCYFLVGNGGEAGYNTRNVTYSNNTITRGGIRIRGRTGIVKIVNNDITDGQILVSGNPTDDGAGALAAPVIITGNSIYNAKNIYVDVADIAISINETGGAITVSDNIIVTPGTDGIWVGYGGDTPAWHSVSISGNQIYQAAGYGIYLVDVDDAIVTGNRIEESTNLGIYLLRSDDNIVSGNRLYNTVTYSIRAQTSSNNVISGNLIKDAGSQALRFDDCSYNIVTDNRIIDAPNTIASIEYGTSDYNLYRDNILTGATRIVLLGAHSQCDTMENEQQIGAVGNTIQARYDVVELYPLGDYTLTSTPTIPDGVKGQVLTIMGKLNVTDSVTLQDQDTLASSNIQLGANTRAISGRDVLVLLFNGTDWIEISYQDN